MLERLRRNFTEANYGVLFLELVLVVVGILIAFQIDRWAEERRDREEEYQYLLRLQEDLNFESTVMQRSIDYAEERLDDVRLLEAVAANPALAQENPTRFIMALEQVTWRSFPQVSANVYSELQSTGNQSLIRSESIRSRLSEYYSFYDHYAGIGDDLQIQNRFSFLTAGLLTTKELTVIQSSRRERQAFSVTPERALSVAMAFSDIPEAVRLLPSIAQHHVHNQRYVGININRGKEIVEALGEESARFRNQ